MARTTRGSTGAVAAGSARRFAARARARRMLALRPLLLTALVLALLGGTAWVLLASPWLAVRHVTVVGVARVSQQQVLTEARVPVGTPLLRLDAAGIARRIESLRPVAAASVQRHWPSTVVLAVTERTPAAVLAQGSGFRLLDPQGVDFASAPARPKGLPLVRGVPVGDRPRLQAAVSVVTGLPGWLAAQVVDVSAATTDSVVLRLRGGRTVLWGDAGGEDRKAAVLQALMRQKAKVYDVSAPDAPTTRQ